MNIKKLLVDFFVYAGNSVAIKVVSLLTVPIIARIMSVEDFGVIETVTSSIALLPTIIGLGYDVSVLKEFALEDNKANRSNILTTISVFLLVWGGVIIFFGIFWAERISTFAFKNTEFTLVIRIAMLNTYVNLFYALFLRTLRALYRTKAYSVLNISHGIVQNVIILFTVGVLHLGMEGYFFAMLATTGIWTAMALIMNRDFRKGHFDKQILKRTIVFGIPVMISSLAYWIFNLSDRIILTYLTSPQETGYYSMAIRSVSMLPLIVSAFNSAWTPRSFGMYRDNPDGFQEVYETVHKYCLIGISIAVLANTAGGKIMILILGSERYMPALTAVGVLAMSYIFQCLTHVACVGIYLKNKTVEIAVGSWIAALMNVIINIILMPTLGATAGGISTLVSYIFLYFYYYYRTCKHLSWKRNTVMVSKILIMVSIVFFCIIQVDITNIVLDCVLKLACIFILIIVFIKIGYISIAEIKTITKKQ